MLVRVRPDARRVLRWAFVAVAVWYLAGTYVSLRPNFNEYRHSLYPLDTDDTLGTFLRSLNDPINKGKLSEDWARDICRIHGFEPFHESHTTPRRRVYDLLLLNTELDWLEIHLSTLFDHVDYFIIVEATKTFTGRPKPLHLKENWSRFERWESKIIHHELEYAEDWKPPRPWDFEDLQRDATFVQVIPHLDKAKKPRWGDVIVVADLDEIPRPATIALLRTCVFPKRLTLRSAFYYYSFQFRHRGLQWEHPQATYYTTDSGTIKPVNLRNGDGGIPYLRDKDKDNLWNAAWHCSSCFSTVGEMLNKMASFSHVSLNRAKFRDPARIADRVRTGKDLWDRPGEEYDRIHGNSDVPPPLREDPHRWDYMLNRDGDSAGFSDYP